MKTSNEGFAYFYYEDFKKMIFWAHDESFATTHMSPIKRKFFCACKSKWKRLQTPVPSMASSKRPENSIMLLMRPREYLLLQRLSSPRPPLASVTPRFRNSSCCCAHVYYTPTRGAPQCQWMDGWMDGCMDFFFSFFYLLALLDDEIWKEENGEC